VTQLVERDGLLAALAGHMAAAGAGAGRVVLLPGQAGVGKTAVLDRFAHETGATVHVGRCEPLSPPRPLGPWVRLASTLGVALDEPRAMLHPVLAALDGAGPTLLAVDDLHWADEATLDLFCLLARRIATRPTLLLVTYRDDEIGPAHPLRAVLGYLAGVAGTHRLPVAPLSPAGVADLATGHRVDVAELHRMTGGNPFFVTEVLAAGGRGVPGSVADAVVSRLDRLSPSGRRTAEAVAVFGDPAPPELLAGLGADLPLALDDVLAVGLLEAVGVGVGYRHELARLAVLESVPEDERTRLHARILRLLRGRPEYANEHALLAHHAAGAGDVPAILEHTRAAAGQAAAVGAYREAADQLDRAVAHADTLPLGHRAELREQVAQLSGLAGRLDVAAEGFAVAAGLRRELGDRLREGDDLRWLSFVLWPLGRPAESIEAGRRAVATLEALEPSRELAAAHLNLCRLAALDFAGIAATEAAAAPAIRFGERFGAVDVLVEARYYVGMSHYVDAGSDDADGWTRMESALAEAEAAGVARSAAFMAMLMGMMAVWRRDHARNHAAVTVIERLLADDAVFSFLDISDSQRSYRALHQGHWELATELAAGVLGRSGAAPTARVLPLLVLGLVRARRGDPDVWPPLDEALGVPEPSASMLVRTARAEAAWLAGDLGRARTEAAAGLAAAPRHMDPWVTDGLARWSRLAGGPPSAPGGGTPFALEQAGDWSAAATAWEARGCPYDAAVARLDGDVPALIHALQAFEALGAASAAAIARDRLRAHGVRLGSRRPRAGTRADRHGLTARQREILDLVGDGLTDAQIAARLQLSVKTVNNHVTAVLGKLGVRSRAQAVHRLAEP
jgi:DNA-binding CsgD family transcriptional regulator